MRKILLLVFLVPVISGNIFSQYEAIGARSAAMGDASVNLMDTWSAFNNPAALGFTDQFQIGVSYKNNFLISELSQYSGTFSAPIKKVGVFALTVDRFGYSEFAHNKFGISYS